MLKKFLFFGFLVCLDSVLLIILLENQHKKTLGFAYHLDPFNFYYVFPFIKLNTIKWNWAYTIEVFETFLCNTAISLKFTTKTWKIFHLFCENLPLKCKIYKSLKKIYPCLTCLSFFCFFFFSFLNILNGRNLITWFGICGLEMLFMG